MARTILEIQSAILVSLRSRSELSGLDSSSASALYVLFAYIVAVAIATLENLFDAYRIELRQILAAQSPHTLRYYQQRALDYLVGTDLVAGTTSYPELSAATIEAQRIVRYASVLEAGDRLQIKVAKENIEPLSSAELAGFTDYMQELKDAGVRLDVSSEPADRLRAEIDIYYNPQILDASGRRLDGTNERPVFDAIVGYTENLRFDGQFVTASMVDALQRTEGVQVPSVRSVAIAPNGDPAFVQVRELYFPSSGFVRLYSFEDLVLNYIAYADA